jgi:hypothetical protein
MEIRGIDSVSVRNLAIAKNEKAAGNLPAAFKCQFSQMLEALADIQEETTAEGVILRVESRCAHGIVFAADR